MSTPPAPTAATATREAVRHGNDTYGGLAFSADGQNLAFPSLATDLTAGVVTDQANLFVRNLATGTTTLVSPEYCRHGRREWLLLGNSRAQRQRPVRCLRRHASNLVANDLNGQQDVFVRDLSAQTTALASVRSPLLPAAYPSGSGAGFGSVSADGNDVAFTSTVWYSDTSSDLAPGVTFSSAFSTSHVFVRNRQTGAIQVVDLDSTGTAVGGSDPVISADGRFVAFVGYTNLLPAGITAANPNDLNVFVRDLQTNTTSLVSVDASGTHDAPVDGSVQLAISADGSDIAWTSADTGARERNHLGVSGQ